MLLDIHERFGMAGMVEADMGLIQNRWKDEVSLKSVAEDVLAGLQAREPNPHLRNKPWLEIRR